MSRFDRTPSATLEGAQRSVQRICRESVTADTLQPTQYHPETRYARVPDRAKLGCDWPYAVRRYNGSGVNSYHYQYQVLQRLTTRPPISA